MKEEEKLLSYNERKKNAPNLGEVLSKQLSTDRLNFKNPYSSLKNLLFGNKQDPSSKKIIKKTKTLNKNNHKKLHPKLNDLNETLINQRNQNIRGFINKIIDIKQSKGLKLEQLEDKLLNTKFNIDNSRFISSKNLAKFHPPDLLHSSRENEALKKESYSLKNVSIYSKLAKKKLAMFNENNQNEFIKSMNSSQISVSEDDNSPISFKNQIGDQIIHHTHDGVSLLNDLNHKDSSLISLWNHSKGEVINNNLKLNYYPKQNRGSFLLSHRLNNLNPIKETIKEKEALVKTNSNGFKKSNLDNSFKSIASKENILNTKKNNTIIHLPSNLDFKNSQSKYRILRCSSSLYRKNQEREKQYQMFIETTFRHLQKTHKVYDSLSEEEEEEVNPKFLIYPESNIKKIWDHCILIILFYTMIFPPIYMAFYKCYSRLYFGLDIVTSILYLIDLLMQFVIPYPNNENEYYVTSYQKIAINYMSSWLLCDFVSFFPYEVIIQLNNGKQTIYELFKLFQLLKILKVSFHSYKINKSQIGSLSIFFFNSSNINRLIIFFLIFIIFNHILACVWCFLGKISNPNWILYQNLQDSKSIHKYFSGMYYNLATIYTVGYGDLVAISYPEKVYSILLQSIGIFIYSFVVSNMINIVKLTPKEEELERKINLLNEIRMNYSINEKLYAKIFRLIKYDYKKNKDEQINLIKTFPIHIRNVLIQTVFKDLLTFKFFKNTNYDFISKIILNLKPIKFSFGDVVIKEDGFIDELIFVIRGILSIEKIYKTKIIKIAEIRRGENFGEINMLLNKKSSFDIIVKSKVCECLVLAKEIMIEIISEYKDIFSEKERIAMINFTLFEKKLKKKKREIDRDVNKKQFSTQFQDKSIYKKNKISEVIQEVEEESNREEETQLTIGPKLLSISKKENKDNSYSDYELNYTNVTNYINPFFASHHRSTQSDKGVNRVRSSQINVPNSINNKKKMFFTNINIKNKSFSSNILLPKNIKINKFRRRTVLIEQNIQEGSLNINQPKVFYENLFDKIKIGEQIKKMQKLLNKIKKQYEIDE